MLQICNTEKFSFQLALIGPGYGCINAVWKAKIWGNRCATTNKRIFKICNTFATTRPKIAPNRPKLREVQMLKKHKKNPSKPCSSKGFSCLVLIKKMQNKPLRIMILKTTQLRLQSILVVHSTDIRHHLGYIFAQEVCTRKSGIRPGFPLCL